MIKKILYIIIFIPLIFSIFSCASFRAKPAYYAPVAPPAGFIVTSIKSPLTVNFNGNPVGDNLKKSTFSRTNWVGIGSYEFAFGNVDIGRIAKNAGITEISYADYKITSILGLWARFTVNIYGN